MGASKRMDQGGVKKGRARAAAAPPPPAAGHLMLEFIGGLSMGKVVTGMVALATLLAYLLGGLGWLSSQIVWASQFNAVVGDFNCQFADIKRGQLEGQLADADYRIGQAGSKKLLSNEEAQDLAKLKVQRDQLQRRLNSLPECDPVPVSPRYVPQQQQRK